MRLKLSVLPGQFAICRFSQGASIPIWALSGSFFSITRTSEELSVVCSQGLVPSEFQSERNWRCLKVEGPLDFALTGVLASIAEPLARANISIFSISTYDTDYLFVKESDLEKTISILSQTGHEVRFQGRD
ncbi:ACT domain-containing protein [Candidatus Acetothermia bacterium]|nr:ACT domain-containing protein [Candidatus Acetothermia bacterium]